MYRFRTFAATALLLALAAAPARAAALEEIDAHTARGNAVFVVLTDAAAEGLDGARAVARAAQQRVPGSAVVELDRSDPTQRAAVAKYRVAGAPVPLILVIAPNGTAVGAARPAAKGAVERVVGLVPSPSKAEYLRILNERKVAIVVFSRKTMKEQSALFEHISELNRTPLLKLRFVLVDIDDPREKTWIAQWKLDPGKLKRPFLVFVDPKGRILGNLTGAPSAAEILAMSNKKVKGCGCGNPNCKGHK